MERNEALTPSSFVATGYGFETAKRLFLLDISTSKNKDIVASLVYTEKEKSQITVYHKDYDIQRIMTGALIEVALKQQSSLKQTSEIPIRLEKSYRFLKKGFDFERISNEVFNMDGDGFFGMNIYTNQLRVYGNVPSCTVLEIASLCKTI
jgi:hypothetical protein